MDGWMDDGSFLIRKLGIPPFTRRVKEKCIKGLVIMFNFFFSDSHSNFFIQKQPCIFA
jgi:hypothetical protein